MKISVNFDKEKGKIKPMHAVGQPPLVGINTSYFKYLKEANIPYSRLHDVGGPFGGNLFVDIPNIFRDFDADPLDENNYDFEFTDILIKGLMENDCEPIFRLGVTIENYSYIKAYRIVPPEDYKKWAVICERIILHYNEGWANGFNYNIKYWEIWNEPDNGRPEKKGENMMWTGTMEDFFDLYEVTSVHLRKRFGNTIKIGGYASSGFYFVNDEKLSSSVAMGGQKIEMNEWQKRILYFKDFFEKFIERVKEKKLPLDFFSHHSYAGVKDTVLREEYVEKVLEHAGINCEIHLNEWNTNARTEDLGKSLASANYAAFMIGMHATKNNLMCFYDARIRSSDYAGLFNTIYKTPYCAYYAFKAFGKLYEMGTENECKVPDGNIYAIAASGKGRRGVLIANIGDDAEIETNLTKDFTAYLINENSFMEKIDISAEKFMIRKNDVIYFEK